MYSIKDQANIYLERINSRGKAVANTLLIIIPLFILLLIEVQSNYKTIQVYLSGRISNFKLTEAKINATDSIAQYNKEIGDFYAKLPPHILLLKDTLKANKIKEFIQKIEQKKDKQKQNFRFYNTAKRIHNDSLEAKLGTLKIPFELPILKKTTNLTIRTVTLIVMLLLSGLLAYLYSAKLYIIGLLKKFISLKPLEPFPESENAHADIQLKLPTWVLPLNNNIINNEPAYEISNIMGISKKNIRFYNLTMVLVWCLFLILNFLLAKLNWDIHFKLYHQHYSLSIACCFFLFLFDIVIIMQILMPLLGNQERTIMITPKSNTINRAQFIAMTTATIGSFIFEPVYSYFKNGDKWFHKPRYINHKKNKLLAIGFYTNVSKSKKRKHLVYYVSTNQMHFMKCAPNPEKFRANLKEISFKTILSKPAYLHNLNENILLIFLKKQQWQATKLLAVMNRYLESTNYPITLQFIDWYTTIYKNAVLSKLKGVTKNRRVIEKISEIKNNPFDYLPRKYLHLVNTIKPDNQQEFTKERDDLQNQLLKRTTGWNNRLNYIGHSRSLM